MGKDYYKILGVTKGSSDDEIKKVCLVYKLWLIGTLYVPSRTDSTVPKIISFDFRLTARWPSSSILTRTRSLEPRINSRWTIIFLPNKLEAGIWTYGELHSILTISLRYLKMVLSGNRGSVWRSVGCEEEGDLWQVRRGGIEGRRRIWIRSIWNGWRRRRQRIPLPVPG